MYLFKGNPLVCKPVLSIEIPNLPVAFGSGKVSDSFWLNDNLLLVKSDRIGAFDQPHRMEDGQPAFYPGKGEIINAFNLQAETWASGVMPTDHIELTEEHFKRIPQKLWSRCSLHLPVKERVLVEAIVRTGCEGSMAKTAKEAKPLCGQEISPDLYKGQSLDRPMFTPTSKAPKGEKDIPYTLEEYYREVGDKAVANYIYGMSVLLHLRSKAYALAQKMDKPDDKFEFGIFEQNLPICGTPMRRWRVGFGSTLFNNLCRNSGLTFKSCDLYRGMPLFDSNLFYEFAEENSRTGKVRLIDERGSTDSSRFRLLELTLLGRQFAEKGLFEQAELFLNDFWCKEWFRTQSKLTGEGGYDESSKQIVTLPDWVLAETGRRNLMAYYRLYPD